ncbi:MAG: hypothetical protein EAZ74_03355 [Alphaproteobacteria bacterium]|nr:MAG: hypothetical protein EAY76_03335 [Alphaproteobacteria bacterium]TAF14718.1 MAG: hypothetical protein EAZ74_03355 [Alphaproteobacteria bacterium]TAF38886.1 MAG: hypothetical protein EAZ66_05735 [Alphaproteobacteria bacterium]TAF75189.1 MAG: hypothetical protein EAZ52_07220 [Alphaproteobacteria bacterium]
MAANEGGGEVIIALWAIFVPIIMMLIVLVPPYFFSFAALYLYYGDPILNIWDQVGRIFALAEKIIIYGFSTKNLPIIDFYVLVMGTLSLGLIAPIALMYFFVRHVRGIFKA